MRQLRLGIYLLAFVLLLSGCGGGGQQSVQEEADAKTVAGYVVEQVPFDDDIEAIDDALVLTIYGISQQDVTSYSLYASSGATASEVAVFVCTDADAAKRVQQAAEERVQRQLESFETYIPAELPKLQDPLLVQSGNTVALCVSGHNDEASEALKHFGIE